MATASPILLLTRPQAQSEAFADDCRRRFGRDLPLVISPVLRIVQLPAPVNLDGFDYVIATSANALPAVEGLDGAGRTAYCVGVATSQRMAELGFDAQAPAATAGELLEQIKSNPPGGEGLYLRGRYVAQDIAGALRAQGISLSSRVVYDQVPQDLTPEARDVLKGREVVVLPVFSPRSAGLLSEATGNADAPLHIVAMSEAVADAWTGPRAGVTVAATPDRAHMLQAIAPYFDR